MNDVDLDDLYAAHARSIGAELHVRTMTKGVITISRVDHGSQMEIANVGARGVRYLSHTTWGRQHRVDAPLLTHLAHTVRKMSIYVPLLAAGDGLPESLRTCLVILTSVHDKPGDNGMGDFMVSIPSARGQIYYDLEGPVGLEDLLLVVRDALLTGEPSSEMDCRGPHGMAPPEATGEGVPEDVRRLLMLKHPLCQQCLDLMEQIGVPVAPSRPEEW